MRALALLLITVLMSGCIVVTERPYTYSRYEIDAINAEMACRNMARTILQIERCGVRR